MSMTLQQLSAEVAGARTEGNGQTAIRRVVHDSRSVREGDLFACLVGAEFDGHRFAADALARGASALLVQQDRLNEVPANTSLLVVPDTRVALPRVAAAACGNPSRSMMLVGITGTNGKTTTTNLVAGILSAAGNRTGTIGTLGAEISGEQLDSEHTTPEADQLQALLAEMKARGATAVVMEVSSHAIAKHRTEACHYDVGVFTNLTQDHLDFHHTLDEYFATKLRLFTEYAAASDKPFSASVNADDPRGATVAAKTYGNAILYGIQSPSARVRAIDVETSLSRVRFHAETPAGSFPVELRIGGAFQVYNALAAIGVGYALGVPCGAIAEGLASVRAVPGRFEAVPTGRGFDVVVDYAHTPDGLQNLLRSARRLNPARLIVVFGCGGDRDRTKRPIMGSIVSQNADIAVVTSDNPRSEDPDAIIQEILVGMDGTANKIVEPDRRSAIAEAIAQARDGDIVLIAGKGHETYQVIGDRSLPFDDRQVAREILGTE